MASARESLAARAGGLTMLGVGGTFGIDGGAGSPVMPEADREALTVLLSVIGVGPLTLGRLVERLGSPAAILDAAVRAGGEAVLVEASRDPESTNRAMPFVVAQAIIDATARRTTILAEAWRGPARRSSRASR